MTVTDELGRLQQGDDPRYYRFPTGDPYRVVVSEVELWYVTGDCGDEIVVTVPIDGTAEFCSACFDRVQKDKPVRPPLEMGMPSGGPQWVREHQRVIAIAEWSRDNPERTWHRVSGIGAVLTYCGERIAASRTGGPTRAPGSRWNMPRSLAVCPLDHAGLCAACFPPRAT